MQANTYTLGRQQYPAVAFDAGGAFIVVLQGDGSSGSGHSIQGQRFINPKVFADGFESGDASAWN